MEKSTAGIVRQTFGSLVSFLRKIVIHIVSVGPMPKHISFILDGNRRFARRRNYAEGAGHWFGWLALLSMLKYCYEMGVRYVSIYAFSIDNFRRRPEEVAYLMNLMRENIECMIDEESIVTRYGARVYFVGNLKLMSEPVRVAMERAMLATAKNSGMFLLVCVGYTSADEIVHAARESCREKYDEISIGGKGMNGSEKNPVKLVDIEKHMYMAVAPDPDILIRTSGETRLSNYLLWQTAYTYLYSPSALWPEIGFRHLVWATLNFQRNKIYLDKRRTQL